jgi:hypothetical protein
MGIPINIYINHQCYELVTRLCIDVHRLIWGGIIRFDENYGLASPQLLKNGDIPEGGTE